LLSGVQVDGQDAAGNSFQAMTDSTGAATISGLPGTWQFTFANEGYQTLNLNYNVTQTEEADAYLLRAS
jgi:VCBS repeat-containing protein